MFDLDLTHPAARFAIALFIGALIGLERERKIAAGSQQIGGIRTFTLLALCGALSAWLAQALASPWIFAAFGLAAAALVAVGYLRNTQARPESLGLTTEIAAIVTFLLGGTAIVGPPELAVALSIAASAVLAYKQPLHGFVHKLGEQDLYAAIKLLIATFIVLPVLPNRALDPWGALNPYEIWVLVILISALSLIGYVATRWLGERLGTVLTGIFGGLVSSTAVTLALARKSRETATPAIVTGIVLAWSIMFVRVIVETAIVHAPLVPRLAPEMGAMTLAAAAIALIGYRRAAEASSGDAIGLRNPFSLTSAIKFAALFAAVLIVVALVKQRFPDGGVYAVAALAGLTDVDAITLSMARDAKGGGDPQVAVRAITIAAFTNTLAKCALVLALGASELRGRIVATTLVIVGAGAVALLLG